MAKFGKGSGSRAEGHWTKEEILGQRLVEIIRDKGHDGRDPVLFLERIDRLHPEALSKLMGDEVEDRATIARDDNGLPVLHLSGELHEAVLGVSDRYGRHVEDAATSSPFCQACALAPPRDQLRFL